MQMLEQNPGVQNFLFIESNRLEPNKMHCDTESFSLVVCIDMELDQY